MHKVKTSITLFVYPAMNVIVLSNEENQLHSMGNI